MIDELRTSEIFNDWFGNRWSAQVGTHKAGNILSYPTDLRIEWTVARPWSYTHRVPNYGTYTHNGRCLGFEYGPNSQLLLLENRWWINTRNRLKISFEQLKWGKEPEEDMADNFDFGKASTKLKEQKQKMEQTEKAVQKAKEKYEANVLQHLDKKEESNLIKTWARPTQSAYTLVTT